MSRGYLAITFDDGHKTDLTVALQAQLDRGMDPKGTSYIIGGASETSRLSNAEIRTLFDNGWDIQSHTYSHTLGGPDGGITGMTPDELREDVYLVYERFDEIGIPRPKHLAYPGGGNNEKVRDIYQNFYLSMRDTWPRFMIPGVKRTNVPSFFFDNIDEDLEMFKNYVDMCVKHNLMMTTFGHQFTRQSQIDAYGEFLDHVIASGIRLVTISELYELIR